MGKEKGKGRSEAEQNVELEELKYATTRQTNELFIAHLQKKFPKKFPDISQRPKIIDDNGSVTGTPVPLMYYLATDANDEIWKYLTKVDIDRELFHERRLTEFFIDYYQRWANDYVEKNNGVRLLTRVAAVTKKPYGLVMQRIIESTNIFRTLEMVEEFLHWHYQAIFESHEDSYRMFKMLAQVADEDKKNRIIEKIENYLEKVDESSKTHLINALLVYAALEVKQQLVELLLKHFAANQNVLYVYNSEKLTLAQAVIKRNGRYGRHVVRVLRENGATITQADIDLYRSETGMLTYDGYYENCFFSIHEKDKVEKKIATRLVILCCLTMIAPLVLFVRFCMNRIDRDHDRESIGVENVSDAAKGLGFTIVGMVIYGGIFLCLSLVGMVIVNPVKRLESRRRMAFANTRVGEDEKTLQDIFGVTKIEDVQDPSMSIVEMEDGQAHDAGGSFSGPVTESTRLLQMK